MNRVLVSTILFLLAGSAGISHAQSADAADGLVSTWMLVAVDKGVASSEPTRTGGARGVLIIDGAGNVFEYFSTNGREEPAAPRNSPAWTLANVGGFWGRYEVNETAGQIEFQSEDGVSPSVRGISFARNFELNGDQLILTSTDEPHAQGDTRWTWQRIPTIENLSPAYREVVGFWRHIEERRVDVATGEVQNSNLRAPSVIVYTPGGFVGVHFPTVGRQNFTDEELNAEEIAAGIRGYLGYFGTLNVYPGEVAHNVLSGVSPTTGSILRRFAAITGDELRVTLGGGGANADTNRPQTVTEVVLHRLSGADDMLPR